MPRTMTSWGTVVACLSIGAAVACRGGNSPATVTPTGVPSAAITTATPMPTPPTEAQISAAYLAYWDAYATALLNLDPSLAQGVATGEELERIKQEIADLRGKGVALRVTVTHDFAVVKSSVDGATVVDRYVDRSFYVDPSTKEPQNAEVAGKTITDNFEFTRVDGRWIVIRSRRLN